MIFVKCDRCHEMSPKSIVLVRATHVKPKLKDPDPLHLCLVCFNAMLSFLKSDAGEGPKWRRVEER